MRRSLLFSTLATVLGLGIMGASTCSTTGPAARRFEAGSLVIPMDNCYQRRDGSGAPGGQSIGCNSGGDDGVFRAYGLVYFLLKHGVTVYWAIDGASPKQTVTAPDVVVPAPGAGKVVAQHMSWTDGAFTDVNGFPQATSITYVGGPFVIDQPDADRVVSMLTNAADPLHADFERFKAEAVVDIHKIQVAFDAAQVRPLNTAPPRLAILNINPAPIHKTSVDVMYRYAVAAGLSWPCTGNGDCAGGIGPSCKLQSLYDYLANRTFVDPVITTPPATNPQAVFNSGPGLAYDILCDGDFIPPPGGAYADTYLAKGNYKLLWAPHWDTAGVDPLASPPTTASTALAAQLKTIADYVNAGGNLFAECLAIGSLETGRGEKGIAATRFQTTAGMTDSTGSGNSTLVLDPIAIPKEPNVQVGDFVLRGQDVDGAITTFHPDNAASAQSSVYRAGVQRLIFGTAGNKSGSTCNPACTGTKVCWNNACVEAGPWDVATTFVVPSQDGIGRGTVAYLGGHDYSPSAEPAAKAPGDHAQAGVTAGTRIVLNTLFNLGFACADPNTPCTTSSFGACAKGFLKCAAGGGVQCVGAAKGVPKCDEPGEDNNCNGTVDSLEDVCQKPACSEGMSRACYDGPQGTAGVGTCRAGQQTCTGGLWGPCRDQVLPQHEVCNGLDDDCNGQVDDGSLCGLNATCQAGLCLPSSCNSESARCPNGFTCSSVVDGTCQAVGCPTSPCLAGKVCDAGSCADPCAGVTCGTGSSCSGGRCVSGGCALTPCADPTNVCVSGNCVVDPCAGNTCPQGTFCRLGDCVRSCSYVSCAAGQHCDVDGFCVSECASACASGTVCVAGGCVADPCAGVQCAAGQECHGGACVDASCSHVTCPVGDCVAGQCTGHVTVSVSTPVTPAKPSGGCGTGAGGDLTSLGLALGALWSRRRRWPALLAGVRRGAVVAVGLALAVGAGCSKGGSGTCASGQSACGADCVDLQTSTVHCGSCGHGCADGFACSVGACAFPTGNPFVASVSPSAFSLGASPALQLRGVDFKAGATVRVSGIGPTQELPLDVHGATSATLAGGAISMDAAAVGVGELRVLNPGRLVSNAVPLSVVDALGVRLVTPASVRQDGSGPVDVKVVGVGFVQGSIASLVVGAAVTPLPTTFDPAKAGELHATLPAPSTLPVGPPLGLVITNPGGASSTAAPFSVIEGAPTVASIDPACALASPNFAGSVTGTFLYPTSVVHVSGPAISDSVLPTSCLLGTDALGRCVNGQLRVAQDLTTVTPGAYAVTVVNPGSPDPLKSAAINVTIANQCP